MAKRVRASRSAHRPGGQGPSRGKRGADASAPTAESATPATPEVDIDAAVEVVETDYSELTLEESTPAPAPVPTRTTRRRAGRRAKTKSDELELRAAAESVWVREDLRRIGVVSAVLLAALALAWILFVALDVLSLY